MSTRQRRTADARIIQAANEVCAIYAQIEQLEEQYDTFPDEVIDPLLDRVHCLTTIAAQTKARTMDAVAAKLRLIQMCELDDVPPVIRSAVNEFVELWNAQSLGRLQARLEASDARRRVGDLQLVA